jgi:hypothetical protein
LSFHQAYDDHEWNDTHISSGRARAQDSRSLWDIVCKRCGTKLVEISSTDNSGCGEDVAREVHES